MIRIASTYQTLLVIAGVFSSWMVVIPLPAQQPNGKLPIPEETARQKGETLIREVFAKDFASAKTSSELTDFAKLLLRQSVSLKDNAAEYYAVLDMARDLAVQAGNVELALGAVKRLDDQFAMDGPALQIETLRAVGKESRSPSQFRSLAQAAMPLIDAAAGSDQHDSASQLGTLAVAAARRARDDELLRRITDRLQVIDRQRTQYAAFQQAEKALLSDPHDPESNGIAGRYLCLSKGDWRRGLPLLAKGDDAALKRIAVRDLAGASTAAEKIELGDAWWELAGSGDAPLRDAGKLRAGAWYKAAQPLVTGGLNKVKLDKRLPEIARLGRPIPSIEPPPRKPPVSPPPTPGTLVRVSGTLSKTLVGHESSVKSVAFSPDGKILASTGADGTIRFWGIPSATLVRIIKRSDSDWNNLSFSPDGKWLACTGGNNDHHVRIWQAADGRFLRVLPHDEKWLKALAFSPDGKMLVAAGASGKISVWDPATGQAKTNLTGHNLWVFSATFTPDGQRLATGGSGHTIKFWDTRSFRETKSFVAHNDRIWSLAFSPDGKLLASSSADKTIRLWDAESGRKVTTIVDHQTWIRRIAISPDSTLLASAGNDSTVRLWDLPTGKPRVVLRGHTHNHIECVAFSPDGKLLASCGSDKTVRLWRIVRTVNSQN